MSRNQSCRRRAAHRGGRCGGGLWPRCVTVRVWFQALLKKHEALMSDLSAYGSSIQALREQAQSCRVSVAVPSAVVVTCGRLPKWQDPEPASRCHGRRQRSRDLAVKVL